MKQSFMMCTVAVIVFCASVVHAEQLYVSGGGDDSNAGTAQAPLKTISAAVAAASQGDEIRVAGGVYAESVSSAVPELTVSGSWKSDFSGRDLAGSRTVIKSSGTCYSVSAVSNTLSGVDLTGGTTGFAVAHKDRDDLTANHHVLSSCIISNNTTGVSDGGDTKAGGIVCRSCLFTGNATGVWANNNNGPYKYFYNCTFADNETGFSRGSNPWAPVAYFKNCIFIRNTKAVSVVSGPGMSYMLTFKDNLWHDNGEDVVHASWRDKDGCTGFSYIAYTGPQYRFDPLLGEDLRLDVNSPATGLGEDLSADAVEPVVKDLYGTPWDGVYDFGCIKSAGTPAAKKNEVFVSPTGDDADDGSEDFPKRTVSAALAVLAENGVCRIADGVYHEKVSIGVDGAKVVGESRDGVVFMPREGGSSQDAADYVLALAADNVVVSNMTVTLGGVGVYVPNYNHAKNARIESVVMSGNRHGYWSCSEAAYSDARTSQYRNRISHCIIRDNDKYGMLFRFATRIDNTLVADNGGCGVYVDGWNGDGNDSWAECGISLAHVTFTGNDYGYYQTKTSYSSNQRFVNCIFDGNATAGIAASSNAKLYSCCFWNNGADVVAQNSTPVRYDARCEDPLLDTTDALRGRLLEGSPCALSGTNFASVVVTMPEAFSNDLDYVKRQADTPDIGCYVSPESLEKLVGNGYHILTVKGEPDTYGEPSPGYGKSIAPDGSLSLSIADSLEDGSLDGARSIATGEGLRVVYKGFTYVSDDSPDSPVRSDAESALFAFTANATWTVLWEEQTLVVASALPGHGTVSINGGVAGSCVSNWVAKGSVCTVTFTPADDHAFESWEGLEDGASASSLTVSVPTSAPATLSVVSRKTIHVSRSGDDAEGDGTRLNPFSTIARAVKSARERDIIKVQSGVYEESVTNTALDELTFYGGYDASWNRDLKSAQSVVQPPSSTLSGFYISGVHSNVVNGFVVRGASRGFSLQGPPSSTSVTAATQAGRISCVHHVEQCVVSNCTYGVYCVDNGSQGRCGVRIYSSLIARNSSHGIYFNVNSVYAHVIHNVSVVSNGGYGAYLSWNTPYFEMRNSVFSGNASGGVGLNGNGASLAVWNCVFAERTNNVCFVKENFNVYPSGAAFFTDDPSLGADFAPLEGSVCSGSGMAMSGHPEYVSEVDLYGTPWGESIDIGCIRSGAPAAKLSDVYVSPSGDDANDGKTPEKPLRSLQKAERLLAPGGTIHLAAGEHAGPVSIAVKGAVLAGAGARRTVIKAPPAGSADYKARCIVHIAAEDVTVRDLSVTGSHAGGLEIASHCTAPGALVERCEMKGNVYGVRHAGYKYDNMLAGMCADVWHDGFAKPRFTHCVISNNTGSGVYVSGRGYCGPDFENTLIARNGSHGANLYDRNTGGTASHTYFYYCTIADNAGTGIYSYSGDGNASYATAVNCIITGNGVGVHGVHFSPLTIANSVVSGNGTDYQGSYSSIDNSAENVLFADLGRHREYRPSALSPACGLARALTADDFAVDPVDDLAGTPRRNIDGKRVSGCYVLPRAGFTLIVR